MSKKNTIRLKLPSHKTIDKINLNGRIYPKEVIMAAVEKFAENLNRLNEVYHPNISFSFPDDIKESWMIDRIVKAQKFEDRKAYLKEIKKYTGYKIIFGDFYNETGSE